MALSSRMDMGTDRYILDITNDETEKDLERNSHSSASNFTILLSPTLDLSSLLYLRSVAAEIAISHLSIDALPLSATRLENILGKIVIPPNITACNTWFNPISITEENNKWFEIPCRDFYAESPQDVVTYTNTLLQEGITQFIMYRFLCVFLDLDIFTPEKLRSLSTTDLTLVSRYIDIALFTRNVTQDTIAQLIPDFVDTPVPGREVMSKAHDGMTLTDEVRHMRNSSGAFRSIRDRGVPIGHKTVDFAKFYGINFGRDGQEAVKEAIVTETIAWLNSLQMMGRDEETDRIIIKPERQEEAKTIIQANNLITRMGLKAREIVEHQKVLVDRRTAIDKKKDKFFQTCFLSACLDQDTKLHCRFHMEKDKFIPSDGTSITVQFPDQLSYLLGAQPSKNIVIGPIDINTPIVNDPRITHNILSEDQQLPHAIRPLPQVIHVVSDLVFSKSRDMWLANTPWRNYHLMYTFVLKQSNISRNYICQINDDKTYCRIQDVNSILESFSFVMLDQSFRRIIFAPYCKVAMRLIIRPVTYGSQ